MRRRTRLSTLLILPVLLVGCEEEPFALATDCTDLSGREFAATDFGLVSAADPVVETDLSRAGAELDLTFGAATVTSTFRATRNATPVVVTSPFTATATTLAFDAPLPIAGIDPAVVPTFACTLAGGVLALRAEDVRFDFDGDGVFEDAVFEATFDAD